MILIVHAWYHHMNLDYLEGKKYIIIHIGFQKARGCTMIIYIVNLSI